MLGGVSSVGPSWAKRNVQALQLFGPVLVMTGILGFVLPSGMSLMSGAPPYNVFHLLAGSLGSALAWRRFAAGAIAFNLVFCAIDLYQALAGVTGWFPAQLFGLRPADHVVHVALGLLLVGLGYLGKKAG